MKKLFNSVQSMQKEVIGVNCPQMKRLLFLMSFILMASTMTLKAQICQRAGNVEVSIKPDTDKKVNDIQVNFENYNSYQVTVYATIHLVGEKDCKKTIERVIVVPPKNTKTLSFDRGYLNDKYISPRDCSVVIRVERCIDE